MAVCHIKAKKNLIFAGFAVATDKTANVMCSNEKYYISKLAYPVI